MTTHCVLQLLKPPRHAAKRNVFMKRMICVMAGVSVLVGLGFYVNRTKKPPPIPPEAVAETTSESEGDEPRASGPTIEPVAAAPEKPPPVVRSHATQPPAQAAVAPVNQALDASLVSRTVDVLVSREASHGQKQEAWKQAREAGKLDRVIVELEQRTAQNPQSAEYPATLGQAYLQKCGTIQDVREQGILAMQADKMFDTALGLDPSNWEARFTKALAMSYWPPMLNKGEEVIQHFQALIQQQESQTPQPQFAETYAWLGDQYQKSGRAAEARATWEHGVALFPADEKLRTRLASAQ
jgi:hypothetical protein